MSKKTEIIRVFGELLDKYGREPTMSELKKYGVTRKAIRYYFHSKEQLVKLFSDGFTNEDDNETTPIVKENVEIVQSKAEQVEQAKKDFTEEKRQFICDTYLEIIEREKRFPVYSDFLPYGVTAGVISSTFGGINKLQEHVMENYGEKIRENFTTLDVIINRNKKELNSIMGKRYVITTAVADFKVHSGFLDALKNYCVNKDAELLILPCESITNSFENKTAVFDKAFGELATNFVTEDTQLNNNLFLCSIQVSAKQIKATTGLTRLGKRGGSYIFASPKQFLDYRPSGNNRGHNYSIMTTGSCTTGDYFANSNFVSKRLSYIADHDHMLGAVIVEVEDDEFFHFRQIQADDEGSFIDLGTKYNPDGSIEENIPMNIVLGDLHGVSVDTEVLETFVHDFKSFNISNVFLHDLFDGKSVSHHIGTIFEKHIRSTSNGDSLKEELNDTFNVLKFISNELNPDGVMYIVKSNHDEFLTRYLKEGRYVYDPQNHYISLKIAIDMLDGIDPLQSGFFIASNYNEEAADLLADKVVFLNREDSVQIAGVELAAHGDLGINGAKPSLNGFEEVYGNCVVGHNHTAAIQRGVFRVGTMSKLNLGYNRGPSSWTHTNCIVYENGQRQLVNFINGRYYM